MKNKIIQITLIIWASCVGMVACSKSSSKEKLDSGNFSSSEALTDENLVKKGRYLVTIMACNDCHSPKVLGPNGPEPDPERMLSGHPQQMAIAKVDSSLIDSWVLFNQHSTAAVGPWGVSFSANITSDKTGIGNWSLEQFIRAIREGKSKGLANNRTLLPPMPWPLYAHLKDEDVKAIFAYLKTVKPVKNIPPPPISFEQVSKTKEQ